jgi:hypothetical protein
MLPEIAMLTIAILEVVILLLFVRVAPELLVGSIGINLILISVFGSKMISVFGYLTNAGNVFYVGTFIAIYLLIERKGVKAAYKAIWINFALLLFFAVMSHVTISITGTLYSKQVDNALKMVLDNSLRITLASLFAYLIGQHVNLRIYAALREQTRRKKMWLRINAANIAGQFLDSAVFFTIAFAGVVSDKDLLTMMIAGFLIKAVVGMIATPFLYSSRKTAIV